MMNLVKSGLGLVAGMGAGAIVTNIVSAFVPKDANKISKLGYLIGGICIVGVVSKQASEYAEDTVDELIELKESFEGEYIPCASKEVAEHALENMKDVLKETGVVPLYAFLEASDNKEFINDKAYKYGWTNLDKAKVINVGNKTGLYLPKLELLKGDDE